jgi:hypothetical protein
MAAPELSLPVSPPRLLNLCLDYVCSKFDKYAPQMPSVTKELKDKLWRFALMEHKIDDQRLPLFFDTYVSRDADLSGCDRITDTSLTFISKKYPNFQNINLSFCVNITAEGVKTIAQNCTTLTTLSLSHCTIGDSALLCIASSLPNIKSLALTGCNNITDTGVSKIASKCQELQYLDISHCKSLTSTSVKAIASSLSNLQHLDISWLSDTVSDSSIQKLNKLHKLQYLGIADSKVTDSILQKLLSNCTKLNSLDISFCTGLFQSDKALKYFTNVTRLNAPGTALTDAMLTKILEVAVDLQHLDVSYSDTLKDTFATNLINSQLGSKLKTINVAYCKHINFKLAQQLQQAKENTVVYFFGGQ